MVPLDTQEALDAAARYGDIDTLHKIFSENPKLTVDFALEDGGASSTLLHVAAGSGEAEAVKYLISKGADPRSIHHSRCTAAHTACDFCMNEDALINVLQILFDKDLTLIDAKAEMSGETCLHVVIQQYRPKVIAWLLDKGADATIQAEIGTAWDLVLNDIFRSKSSFDYGQSVELFCDFVQREARHWSQPFNVIKLRRIRGLRLYEPQEFGVSNASSF